MLDNRLSKHLFFSEIFFIISIIAINLGINEVGILFSIYILFLKTSEFKIPKNIFIFLSSILISGIVLSFIYTNYLNISSHYHQAILLRVRFYVIHILYAFSVTLYLYKVDKIRILHLIYLLAIINLMVGFIQLIYQLFFSTFERLSMLTSEPSSIAMFYVFAVPLLLLYQKYNKNAKKGVWSFIILGILIVSKAQILIFLFWIIVFLLKMKMKMKRKLVIIPIIIIFGLFIAQFFLQIHQVNALYRFLSISFNEGLSGLNEQNQIYTSFTFRLSGALTALSLFWEYLSGIGFGTFHPLYIDYMNSSGLGQLLSGSEIIGVLFEDGYATPKSAFLELLVSCGLFFLIPFFFIAKQFLKEKIPFLIKISFFSLVIISFMVELAPFLTYLIILLVLEVKFRNYPRDCELMS